MKLFASVLRLNRKAIQSLRIKDAYSVHRVVYDLFDDVRSEQEKAASLSSGILYADQGGDFHERRILILSNRPPKFPDSDTSVQGESKSIPEDFLLHDHYRFKLIVNPTRRDSKTKKLMPVKGRDEISQWFCERSVANWGFDVSPDHIQVDKVEILKFQDKNQHSVTIGQANLQGRLRVVDRELFISSFSQGVGRSRAFGCGLLQIVPLSHSIF